MGWNSWNSGIPLSEMNIITVIDAMVSSGMRDAGYRYVNLDAGWAAPQRDTAGDLVADPAKFPHGIRLLADYAHGRGMSLGLYSSPYNQTCGQAPATASVGREVQDARTFADWGVDYLKYDWCGSDADLGEQVRVFTAMRDALRASGRDIVYSINPNSNGLAESTAGRYDWSEIADVVRTAGDLIPLWDNTLQPQVLPGGISTRGFIGVLDELTATDRVTPSRPGYYNDPDMLVVGLQLPQYVTGLLSTAPEAALRDTGLSPEQRAQITDRIRLPPYLIQQLGAPETNLTPDEQRAHFSLWAMLAAPLLAGNDVRTMSAETAAILTSREVIAIDQDPAVAQGRFLPGNDRVMVKHLSDGSVAVALFNPSNAPEAITTSAAEIGLDHADHYTIRNAWTHTTAVTEATISDLAVPAHGVTLLTVHHSR
ncbi:glycoside hydrolase family 27 protein [Nocardia sp. NPDC052112]|uniref:glycoside hydrolase family 27 protein n=1 Tax=Nocardia sp. NPDC052112 TaxID=3155646 RepID=UPI0034136062